MRTRIKICGITRPEDAISAAENGADAIGIVFHAASPRAVGVEQALAVIRVLPPFVTTVALFLDSRPRDIEAILATVPVDVLQFHGREPPELCRSFGRPYLKAMPMGEPVDVAEFTGGFHDASGFLLDSHRPGEAGGTGEAFDWARYPAHSSRRLVLAGGLTPANVGDAVRRTSPWAVDVSSGVESAPGIKDAARMATFIREVQRVQSV